MCVSGSECERESVRVCVRVCVCVCVFVGVQEINLHSSRPVISTFLVLPRQRPEPERKPRRGVRPSPEHPAVDWVVDVVDGH